MLTIITSFYKDNCEVKIPELNKRYEGECRKGLADGAGKAWGEKDCYEGVFKKGFPHGQGIYKRHNGYIYIGEFSKGRMDGRGELFLKDVSGKDSIIKKGYFEKGNYIGEYKQSYKVLLESAIRKIDFRENSINQDEVRITVNSNGKKITPNLTITDVNNTIIENRNGTVLINTVFPLKRVNISFQVNSFSYKTIFDIYKKGNWEVIISL